MTFNAVGVNAVEWHGEKALHDVPFTEPGPLVDEFRFGRTYESVAPIQAPSLGIALAGTSVEVSWLPANSAFVLQMTESLSPPAWGPAPGGNPAVVQMDKIARYFRLIRQ